MSLFVLRQMQDSGSNHGPAINNIALGATRPSALFHLTAGRGKMRHFEEEV